ncbi:MULTISPECIES: hypothetical protein [Burkholderia]|uniref:hypothetical protein n=1 Tax=Burkholderia TaxID=32008 RepID=UPI00104BB10D|nr:MULTISPECIES: hypothetical protein [Burkholderia]
MPIIGAKPAVTFCFIWQIRFHLNAESTTNFSPCETGKTAYSSLCFSDSSVVWPAHVNARKTGPSVRAKRTAWHTTSVARIRCPAAGWLAPRAHPTGIHAMEPGSPRAPAGLTFAVYLPISIEFPSSRKSEFQKPLMIRPGFLQE